MKRNQSLCMHLAYNDEQPEQIFDKPLENFISTLCDRAIPAHSVASDSGVSSQGDGNDKSPSISDAQVARSAFPDTYTHQGVPTLLHWTARRAALRPNQISQRNESRDIQMPRGSLTTKGTETKSPPVRADGAR
jgi:hypothetical protein